MYGLYRAIGAEGILLLIVTLAIVIYIAIDFGPWAYGTTWAEVIAFQGCTNRMTFDAPKCTYLVKYTVDGKEYTESLLTTRNYHNRYNQQPGSKIKVIYKKSYPKQLKKLDELPK